MRISWLQDHKTKHIQYSHATCLWIVQIHCMYGHVMSVFALFLFFSQVDFAVIRLLADWIVTGVSTVWFIQDKVYDPSARRSPSTVEHSKSGASSSSSSPSPSSTLPMRTHDVAAAAAPTNSCQRHATSGFMNVINAVGRFGCAHYEPVQCASETLALRHTHDSSTKNFCIVDASEDEEERTATAVKDMLHCPNKV